jgi:predicted nucleic acid-binding protein
MTESTYLIDTNILVYAYDVGEPDKRARAISVLDHVFQLRCGALTTQVLSEFFVTVTRKLEQPLSTDEAERSVRNYSASWPVFAVGASDVAMAIRGVRRHGLSYWDSLIWAVAKNQGPNHVLSEDFSSESRIDGVRFTNPLRSGFELGSIA